MPDQLSSLPADSGGADAVLGSSEVRIRRATRFAEIFRHLINSESTAPGSSAVYDAAREALLSVELGRETPKPQPLPKPPAANSQEAADLLARLDRWWDQVISTTSRAYRRIEGTANDQRDIVFVTNPFWDIIRRWPLEDRFPSSSYFSSQPDLALYLPEIKKPAFEDASSDAGGIVVTRDRLCHAFSWAIPSPGDIRWIGHLLTSYRCGLVECGAGAGYWAWQLRQAGEDVVAYEPVEPEGNQYAPGDPWTAVLRDGHGASASHPDRALFLCWPSYGDPWAAHSLAAYKGGTLIYCGEPEGGCCADDGFFELLREEWEEIDRSPHHVNYWGIHSELVAYRRMDV